MTEGGEPLVGGLRGLYIPAGDLGGKRQYEHVGEVERPPWLGRNEEGCKGTLVTPGA